MSALDPTTIERTLELRCFINSARMCALIFKTASRYASRISISRGGAVTEVSLGLMTLMMTADGEVQEGELPSPVVKITVSGLDASAAMDAILDLFPPDGGPERCASPGCNNPAVLVGPDGEGVFAYRCTMSSVDQAHQWKVTTKIPKSQP
jgi:phosphotransferase system HPr-like phosphotransfer protein